MRRLADSFAIRISRDGTPHRYVKDASGQLAAFSRIAFALDRVQELRSALLAGDCLSVVPVESVPRKER